MLTNYLNIAWRNLVRHKTNTGINVIGLAMGLAACLLLVTYLKHELSYDAFHANANRLVRVTMEYSADGQVGKVPTTGTKVAPELGRQFSEIESGVRLINAEGVVQVGDKQFSEKALLYADSAFFSLFTFPLLKGNAQQALAGPNLVVLSEATAAKYFGTQNPVGKVLKVNTGGPADKYFTVTGVVANCPANSQIKYDLVASFTTLRASKTEEWWSANYGTYLLLRSPEALAPLQAKIGPFMKSPAAATEMTGGDYLTYNLEPIRRVHLQSEVGGLFEPNGDLTYVYVFGIISLLILLIACVNYINLATARAVERAQEVGVRKVLGAEQSQLFGQFMGESLLVTGAALGLGLLLAGLLLPLFNDLSDRRFTVAGWLNPGWVGLVLGIGLVVALVAGGYPALLLARFRPMQALQGRMALGGNSLRRGLIVFQFAITAFLIVSTLVVRNQLSFIQTKKLGYNRDRVLVLPATQQVADKISTLKSEFKRNAGVAQVSLAYESPVFVNGGYSMHRADRPESQNKLVTGLVIDADFIKTMGIRLLTGEDLTTADMARVNDLAVDSLDRFRFILNEAGARAMGWTPQTALGQAMNVNGRAGKVKAVVADFHFASLKQQIGPLVLFHQGGGNVILVKTGGGQLPETLAALERTWKQLLPNQPFAYQFMDQEFNSLYTSELRTGRIFSVFAFLSIFLGCLGLFGLSAYTTAQRTKEIGVRKVLGASVMSIVTLLSKDFLTLVGIAFVVAAPLAWWAMHRWLQDFAYRVDIAWWVFALAGVLAVGIALLTVSFQSVKAALMNPVKSLRSE
ncbi:ABC transporter permease [Fibrella aquatilis]|uniref:ABC transporter permease n=1 Tax=Fibrella aquatilis TaxID=2817059 RepID=A0A939JYY2_9BACT|nr:ABC transporter permease [Fibrella aquatilis]MBO0930848.1 ABC transporter permease [Fibrella aquatilis]